MCICLLIYSLLYDYVYYNEVNKLKLTKKEQTSRETNEQTNRQVNKQMNLTLIKVQNSLAKVTIKHNPSLVEVTKALKRYKACDVAVCTLTFAYIFST